MELEQAIELLKDIVKENGTNDMRHLDIGLVPTEVKPIYEKALAVAALSIREGKITRDEFLRRIHVEN